MNSIIRTKRAALMFSISKLNLSTFSCLLLLSHQCIERPKRISAKFRTRQDSNQEISTTIRVMALLTCELSNAINVKSLICDPTIAKDPKRTPTPISLSDLQGLLQKNFHSIHVL
jgi:hypothetical protein